MMNLLLINHFVMSFTSYCNYLLLIIFLSNQVRMSWNSGDERNVFLHQKAKLELKYVLLATPKNSPEKHTLTVV